MLLFWGSLKHTVLLVEKLWYVRHTCTCTCNCHCVFVCMCMYIVCVHLQMCICVYQRCSGRIHVHVQNSYSTCTCTVCLTWVVPSDHQLRVQPHHFTYYGKIVVNFDHLNNYSNFINPCTSTFLSIVTVSHSSSSWPTQHATASLNRASITILKPCSHSGSDTGSLQWNWSRHSYTSFSY